MHPNIEAITRGPARSRDQPRTRRAISAGVRERS